MAMKIVIVDDSSTIRSTLKYILEQEGYQVVACASGEESLPVLNQGKVNLVITDLHMDGMDGLELIRRVRAGVTNKYTPILMLTTESKTEKMVEGKAAVANGWLVKPFQPAQLKAVLQKLLG